MITILFFILLFVIVGKLLVFGIKATWGITKLLFTVLFWPVVLIVLFLSGFIYIAFPILIIIGIVSLLTRAKH